MACGTIRITFNQRRVGNKACFEIFGNIWHELQGFRRSNGKMQHLGIRRDYQKLSLRQQNLARNRIWEICRSENSAVGKTILKQTQSIPPRFDSSDQVWESFFTTTDTNVVKGINFFGVNEIPKYWVPQSSAQAQEYCGILKYPHPMRLRRNLNRKSRISTFIVFSIWEWRVLSK